MLNIHFQCLPSLNPISPGHVKTLREVVGKVIKCPSELVVVTFEKSAKYFFNDRGTTKKSPAQVTVQTYVDELNQAAKSGIAQAIYSFLKAYRFGKDMTIIFDEVKAGKAFSEKDGQLVLTPLLPTPQNNFSAFTQKR